MEDNQKPSFWSFDPWAAGIAVALVLGYFAWRYFS